MRPVHRSYVWLSLLIGSLGAAELPAPHLEVHPDGARLTWTLTAAAGEQSFDLPPWCGEGQLQVVGARTWHVDTLPTPVPALPAAAEELRVARNALQVRAVILAAQQAVLVASERRLRARLPRAAGAAGDPAAWQVAMDALLDQQAALAIAEGQLNTDRDHLRSSAGNLAGALAVDIDGPLTGDDLARRWAQMAPPRSMAVVRQRLVISGDAGQSVIVSVERNDLWWRPAARLHLGNKTGSSPATATLTRTATLVKPVELELGVVQVHALGLPLHAVLDGPRVPHVVVQAADVLATLRRQLTSGSRSVAWTTVSAARPVAGGDMSNSLAAVPAAAAPMPADVMPTRVSPISSLQAVGASADVQELRSSPPTQAPQDNEPSQTSYGSGVDLDLGALSVSASTASLSQTLEQTTLTVLADEWAMFPEDSPVAMRRVSVRLGVQPLLAGTLEVVAAGTPRQTTSPAIAGGGVLTVCAAIDETVVVSSQAAWEVDPAANTTRYRRSGSDTWLVNAGPAPRVLVVYRTMPVSTSDELVVTRDAASTPGATVIAPGLLRWTVTLPSGQPQRVGLGWVMQASGSFSF